MRLIATVSGVRLELAGSAILGVPEFDGYQVTQLDGVAVMGIVEDERAYLFIDHRLRADPGEPAYVELWTPIDAVEGGLAGAFVVGDTAGTARVVESFGPLTFRALDELVRGRRKGY